MTTTSLELQRASPPRLRPHLRPLRPVQSRRPGRERGGSGRALLTPRRRPSRCLRSPWWSSRSRQQPLLRPMAPGMVPVGPSCRMPATMRRTGSPAARQHGRPPPRLQRPATLPVPPVAWLHSRLGSSRAGRPRAPAGSPVGPLAPVVSPPPPSLTPLEPCMCNRWHSRASADAFSRAEALRASIHRRGAAGEEEQEQPSASGRGSTTERLAALRSGLANRTQAGGRFRKALAEDDDDEDQS